MTVYAYGKRIPKIHPTAWIHPRADITGQVNIGPSVYVGSGVVVRADLGTIHIGEGSAILENATLQVSPTNTIRVGRNVTISVGAILHNCSIRDGAMVGMGAVVGDFAEIGEGAVVGEGAIVVSKTRVQAGAIAAGVPAKEIGTVSDQRRQFLGAISGVYQDLARKYPSNLREVTPQEYESQ